MQPKYDATGVTRDEINQKAGVELVDSRRELEISIKCGTKSILIVTVPMKVTEAYRCVRL